MDQLTPSEPLISRTIVRVKAGAAPTGIGCSIDGRGVRRAPRIARAFCAITAATAREAGAA